MTQPITVVTIGWHTNETVAVPFEPDISLLHFKDRVRAALGSAAQHQVDLIAKHPHRMLSLQKRKSQR